MFRSHEGPMDFEFQNGTGPVDARSPFAQVSQNAQRFPPSNKKRMYGGDTEMEDASILTGEISGSYSAFDSPTKSKPSHLSSPSKPLPPPPAYNSLFTTPRKTNNDIDDSSAGNTPASPERELDSDATPENMGLRSAMSTLGAVSMPTVAGAERSHSPTKEPPKFERRESWFSSQLTKAKNKFSSPGRGEIPRAEHSGAIVKSTHKKRKREVDRVASRRRRHSVSDSGEDGEMVPRSPRKTSKQHAQHQDAEPKESWISSFYTFIEKHPAVPHIISQYAQLGLNMFLIFCVAGIIWTGWSAVQGDIEKKAHEAAADIMAEMAACAAQYTQNKCDRSTRVPAMESVCENWSRCMNQNAMAVGRAKVGAHVFAEIYNSFVEPLSWKAMIFTAVMVFGSFFIANFAFSVFRRTEGPVAGYQQQYYQPPPPTPQRQFSGLDGGFYAGTPWQQPPAGLEPQPSGGFGQIEGRGSPVRRIQW